MTTPTCGKKISGSKRETIADLMDAASTILLRYDELPPGSDVRREQEADGTRIVVPAGEVPAEVQRAVLQRRIVAASLGFMPILLLAILAFPDLSNRFNRLEAPLKLGAGVAFTVLCGAAIALVSSTLYGRSLDALTRARSTSTLLRVSSDRLRIESSPPCAASHEIAQAQIRCLSISHGPLPDERGNRSRIAWLAIELHEDVIRILPGRDELELRWIARNLAQTLRLPDLIPPTRVQKLLNVILGT